MLRYNTGALARRPTSQPVQISHRYPRAHRGNRGFLLAVADLQVVLVILGNPRITASQPHLGRRCDDSPCIELNDISTIYIPPPSRAQAGS